MTPFPISYVKPNPFVLLLDLKVRRLGDARYRALQKASPSTKIIVAANTPRFSEELLALKLGAAGYVAKDISAKLLRKSVRLVHAGEIWTRRRILTTSSSPATRAEAGQQTLTRKISRHSP